MNDDNWTPLLTGVVGSHAYGLVTPSSDIDRLSIAAAPTRAFHSLDLPIGRFATQVFEAPDPDHTIHEAAKAVSLLLNGNPTVSELLWLDDYEVMTKLGGELLRIRSSFLSAPRVREAYLGYAAQQFHRLQNEGRFPDVPRGRIAKHARHLKRLLDQGITVWRTGELRVRVDTPADYFIFGERVAADPLGKGGERAQLLFAATERAFDEFSTPLPAESNRNAAVDWLYAVRRHYYQERE